MVRWHLANRWTLDPIADDTGGPGRYWRVGETSCRLAFITPMSHGFCATCNRVRVTCSGRLVLCLGERGGVDLRAALRGSEADQRLEAEIVAAIASKPAGHRFGTMARMRDRGLPAGARSSEGRETARARRPISIQSVIRLKPLFMPITVTSSGRLVKHPG